MPYIYCITNKINLKRYIGQTSKTIEARMKIHKSSHRRKRTWDFPLYRAMRKYGFENFIIEQQEECSPEDLNRREVYWIDFFDTYANGYNATYGGEGRLQFDYDAIVRAYENIRCIRDTAKAIGCSVDTVKNVLHSKNIVTTSGADVARLKQGKPIDMLDKDGAVVMEFSSLQEASKWLQDNGYSKTGIRGLGQHLGQACNGIRRTVSGFCWRWHVD